MQQTNHSTSPANQVMALFADRVWSFSLLREATFADLAERLTEQGGWGTDTPKAIYLKFGAARQPVAVHKSPT